MRCWRGIFSYFTANVLENLPVKRYWKSVKIWRNKYSHKFGVHFLAHIHVFKWLQPFGHGSKAGMETNGPRETTDFSALLANTVGKTRLITSIVHVYSVWQSKGTFTQSHWTWSLHACCAVPHIMSFHVASSHICRNTPQYDACPIPYHRLRRPLRLIPSQNARQHVVRVHAAPQQTVSVVKVQFVLNSSDRQDVVSCQN